MTAETILTVDHIDEILMSHGAAYTDVNVGICRSVEQAVLQSPEVQALRKDAERYRWLKDNIQKDYELPGSHYIPDEDTDTWDNTIDAAMEQQK